MDKLFSKQFGIIKNISDLNRLHKKYPQFDRAYLSVNSAEQLSAARIWIEKIWRQYEPFADTNFVEEIKTNFYQRAWELYLGATLINRGFKLQKKTSGPDFCISISAEKLEKVWIEAIAVGKGQPPNAVPDIEYGKEMDVPEKEMILRLTSGLEEKFKKYITYIKKGTLNKNEPYVIALDRSSLQHPDPQIPLILKALFGIGYQTLTIGSGKTMNPNESSWSQRITVPKKNGTNIASCFFDDTEHSGISAVIYSADNIINSPREKKRMGNNFVVVLNPNAKNPLPINLFPFGETWIKEKDSIKKYENNKN